MPDQGALPPLDRGRAKAASLDAWLWGDELGISTHPRAAHFRLPNTGLPSVKTEETAFLVESGKRTVGVGEAGRMCVLGQPINHSHRIKPL